MGVTIIVEDCGALTAAAVKVGRLPVPLIAVKPVKELSLTQLNVAPAVPVKTGGITLLPAQDVPSSGSGNACGFGLTVMSKAVVVPTQPFKVGVTMT